MQTNKKTALETALRVSAHLMLEHASIAMAFFDARTLSLLAANPPFDVLLPVHWRHGHALGHSLTELLPSGIPHSCIECFRQVVETGVTCSLETSGFLIGVEEAMSWQWTLNPIVERGQVHSVVLTVTEATAQVQAQQVARQAANLALAQAQQHLEQEKQQRDVLETLLRNIQGLAEPKAVAQAALKVFAPSFSSSLLALYHTRPAQKTLLLLASYDDSQFPREALALPSSLPYTRGGSLVEAVHQRFPLIKSSLEARYISQDEWRERDIGWKPPTSGSVIYLPLWAQQCEGVLLVAVPGEDAVVDREVQILWACAPFLAEALARARLHTELADERQRVHLLLDQLPEGIVVVEARTSKVRYANSEAADLLGYAFSDLVGTPLNRLASLSPWSPGRQHSTMRWDFALIDALWGKAVTNQEMNIVRSDGSEIIVLCSTAPLRASNGLITDAIIVLQDMTVLKQLERQKNEFFAVANHELRTPLTSILGWVELLQMATQPEANTRQQKAISNIIQEGEHLRQLIQDLLDVSRLEEDHLQVNKSSHELLTPLRDLVNKQARTTSLHQMHFTLDGLDPADRLMGEVDLLRLEQIVTNLLTNAIKYSPGGGDIEVGVRPHRDVRGTIQEMLIWVKDQGIGIAARDLTAIFERFYRADTFERSSISGFGIGLYLTRKLVQAHGGRIWVESTQGQGSTFFVVLPLGTLSSSKLPDR